MSLNSASITTSHPSSFLRTVAGPAHLVAAMVLLLFGLSKTALLLWPAAADRLPNLVFPFASDLTVQLLAGCLELALAIVCILRRGRQGPSLLLAGFVATLLWYRWALKLHGYRPSCGCLGLLARLLYLPPVLDRLLPQLALGLLLLCALPALLQPRDVPRQTTPTQPVAP